MFFIMCNFMYIFLMYIFFMYVFLNVYICVLLRYLHMNDIGKYEFVPSAVNGDD